MPFLSDRRERLERQTTWSRADKPLGAGVYLARLDYAQARYRPSAGVLTTRTPIPLASFGRMTSFLPRRMETPV